MRKLVTALVLAMVLSVLVSGCGGVPKSELDAVNAKLDVANAQIAAQDSNITTLQTNLQTAQGDLNKANTEYNKLMIDLNQANAEKDDYFRKVAKFESLLCKQTWKDVAFDMGMWFPLMDFLPAENPMIGYVMDTQWTTPGLNWDTNKPYSTVLLDIDNTQAFAIDTVNDCLFINPVFSDLGK